MPKPYVGARQPAERDVLWQSLRVMRRATTAELAAVTERPRRDVSRQLRRLARVGYLASSQPGKGRRGASWSILRDTGPKAPVFLFEDGNLIGAVDRNTLSVFGVDGGEPPPRPGNRGFPHLPRRALVSGRECRA